MIYNPKMVNAYAKMVTAFAVVAFCFGVLTVYSSGMKYVFPPVETYDEFTFDAVQSADLQLALSVDTRIQYFTDIQKEDFDDERLLLFNTYQKDVEENRLKEVYQGIVYMILFVVLFNIHRRLVRDTGGWSKED